MRAIILAAGQGTRLLPHTERTPKCLLDLNGTTVLEHQIRNCRRAGISDTVVVTGFQWQLVEAYVSRWRQNGLARMRIETAYNPFFSTTNNLISLWSAQKYMDEDFITINGDNVFDWRILQRLKETNKYPIHVTTAHKDAYDEDDMKVLLDGDRIQAINKGIPLDQADGESIGIMKFTGEGRERLKATLEDMVRGQSAATDWYTRAIEWIARRGYPVGICPIGDLKWAEIDFPQDLARVRENSSLYLGDS
ncbi:MAG: phosphocholine cytidylyltransferase family protein [Deltaproteobacteria bacterium]|nr:phosphocholine cytidylyltransferase family protein [Deltaproteobacteria bacterium]